MTNDLIDINLYSEEIITNPLHLFFQEIELSIKIGPGEIWGVQYAIDLKKYLFNQYITLNQIRNELQTFIANNCEQAKNFPFNISAQIVTIENKDLIYISVSVYSEDENKDFVQNFMLGN